jgi:hypothetical protein
VTLVPHQLAVDARTLRPAATTLVATVAALPLIPAAGIPCPLRVATGVPCPFCGLTRGVGDVLHGDLVGALAHNPASVLLVLAVVAAFLVPSTTRLRFRPLMPLVLLGALWAFQLVKLATGAPL